MKKIYRSFWKTASVFLFLLLTATAFAQRHVVTGTVKDTEGGPFPGVNVVIKGTTVGTATDGDGNYSIEAGDEDILVISFIGYETQEVRVGGQSRIDVTLNEDVSTLNEVVVVGYGEMKRTDLTGAQTSVTSDDIQRTMNTTIEQAIQGRAAGVYITQNTGQPGGSISVIIRGINTINGSSEPLYVVDGVQIPGSSIGQNETNSANPLSGLNPADIESFEILKGPSATAIYGSRATNGVVLITTKRGKVGDTKVTYGVNYSIQTPPRKMDVMNLREYAQMVGDFRAVVGGEVPVEFLDPSLLGEGTDWQDELYRNASTTSHQLSVSGGTEKSNYYLSGDYFDRNGIALGSGYKRYSVRLNMDNRPTKWLTFGTNLSFNQSKTDLTTSQENIISQALILTPQIPVKNLDGTWGGSDATNGANQFAPPNPIALATLTTNEAINQQFLGGLSVGITVLKGLTIRSALDVNLGFGGSEYFKPAYRFGNQENPLAELTNRTSRSTYWRWDQQIEYNKQFGKHSISLMALHEAQVSTWKNLMGYRSGFLVDGVLDLNVGDQATADNGGGQGDWAQESYLGRLHYTYDDKYILTGTFRTDGSVNFGPDNKWGFFPSVAAAWRISQESFFDVPAINELKIRVESGLTGSQGSNKGIYSPLGAAASAWGTGFLPTQYSNPGLKWEETLTNNIGVNVALLENRIQFEFDYYEKETKNLLMSNPLPWYMGTSGQGSVGPPTVNIGSMNTKGWEFSLNTVNLDRGDFKWDTKFNISGFTSTIQSFYSDAAFVDRVSWWLGDWTQRAQVGETPWMFRGYVEEGIFQSLEEIEASALPTNNAGELPVDYDDGVWIGDIKFRDISGPDGAPDGIINTYDATNIGNPYPKLFGGITNNFSYKGFNLSLLLTYSYGNDIYNYLRRINTNPNATNLSRNLLREAAEFARPQMDEDGEPITVNPVLLNPGTNIPRASYGPNGNFERHTNRWVEDGSYLRIKNVTLTYNLPQSLLSKLKIVRGARVAVSAQDVYTFTKYTGYDPEVGAYVGRDASAANQAIGVDYGRYPLTPIYTFSLGVDF